MSLCRGLIKSRVCSPCCQQGGLSGYQTFITTKTKKPQKTAASSNFRECGKPFQGGPLKSTSMLCFANTARCILSVIKTCLIGYQKIIKLCITLFGQSRLTGGYYSDITSQNNRLFIQNVITTVDANAQIYFVMSDHHFQKFLSSSLHTAACSPAKPSIAHQ